MTLVLLVSLVVVTRAAWHASPASPSATFAVCPGARTTVLPATSGVVMSVPSGALPAQLVAQPARLDLLPVFRHWASVCALPAALVEATCWWESGWQETAISVTGAVGLCQIEPAAAQTARGLLGDPNLDPRSSSDNIEMSAAYLRWLLDETGGDQDLTLAGYYQGITSLREHGILAVSKPYVAGITALLNDYQWS
jgi:soluble lytic murein transglycosylase-like protein